MNIILFEAHEMGKALSRRDERTIHLLKVLCKKPGDQFDAGILGGSRGIGRIESVRLDGSLLFTLDLRESPLPRIPLRMAVGFPRPIQIRRILRDLSNLGLEAVDLIGTELGEKSYRDTKLFSGGGAHAALVEGAVQARDTLIPALSIYTDLETWLKERPWDKPRGKSPPYAGNAGGDRMDVYTGGLARDPRFRPSPILVAADNMRPEGSLALLSSMERPMVLAIGSERGWSERERKLLEDAGFLRLSIGKRALRTETACVAAAILAMEKIGELD
jgi:16S rRNA U1498 N3-methylase RsmE